MRAVIKNLNPKKASDYDLITNQILQMLPEIEIKFVTQFYNAVLRQGFFSPQWGYFIHFHHEIFLQIIPENHDSLIPEISNQIS